MAASSTSRVAHHYVGSRRPSAPKGGVRRALSTCSRPAPTRVSPRLAQPAHHQGGAPLESKRSQHHQGGAPTQPDAQPRSLVRTRLCQTSTIAQTAVGQQLSIQLYVNGSIWIYLLQPHSCGGMVYDCSHKEGLMTVSRKRLCSMERHLAKVGRPLSRPQASPHSPSSWPFREVRTSPWYRRALTLCALGCTC